jgi:uncharacterized membrane protein
MFAGLTSARDRRISDTARVEAFSDGVFAIAITLLVLEIHVPDAVEIRNAGGLVPALLPLWPAFLSYLASFLTVGVIWLNHHRVFTVIVKVDRVLNWWNLMLLLAVAFIPFPNALVAQTLPEGIQSADARSAAVIYGAVFTLATVPWVFIWLHVRRRPDLVGHLVTAGQWRMYIRRPLIGMGIYAASAVLGYFLPLPAVILYIALAVFFAL